MRNQFNKLLVVVSLVDTLYLLSMIGESLRLGFYWTHPAHVFLFPKVIYPGQAVLMSTSILLLPSISVERRVN